MSVWWAAAAVLVVLGLVATALWQAPRWIVPRLAARAPDVLYSVRTPERVVALTIDDGPDARTTGAILEVLRTHDARATFFLISERVAGAEAIVQSAVRAGHELGNHLTRDEPSIRLDLARFEEELLRAAETLRPFAPLRWARPGGGWYDRGMLEVLRRHGYRCALGSAYPYDAHVPSVAFASAHILEHVRPGAVIVLHDGGARGLRTVDVLRRVLPRLRRRGYRVTTLSELTALAAAAR